MKTKLKGVILAMSLLTPPVLAGIPVIDAGAIAQAITQVEHMLTQISEMEKQYSMLTDQLKQARQQYDMLTSRSTYERLAKESMQDLVPEDWQALYDLAQVEVDTDYLLNPTGYDEHANVKSLANMDALMTASNKGLHQQSQALEDLLAELDKPEGLKNSADLQNRIALQQAALTLNQSKLDQMYRQYEMQEKILVEQRSRAVTCYAHKQYDPSRICD